MWSLKNFYNYINSINYQNINFLTTSTAWNTTNWMFKEHFLVQLFQLLKIHNFLLQCLQNMSCFNYINLTNSLIINYVNYFQLHEMLLIECLQNMSCFNYFNSFIYIISFCKVYRIYLVSTTLTPSATWISTL